MIRGAIATIVVILVVTAWTTRRAGNRPVAMRWVIPLWGVGLACVVAAGVGIWYVTNLRIYDKCVDQAERSVGGRVQTNQLYDTIDAATHTKHYTSDVIIAGDKSLRDALDDNLPVLDAGKCAHP